MLYIFFENFTYGFSSLVLDILSIITIIFGALIISSKNPIISVLCLIGLFSIIAIYLILLGLNFIGLSYLLVYVGAVSILFIFILMLINIRVSELLYETNSRIPLAIIICITFSFPISDILLYNLGSFNYLSKLYNTFIYLKKYFKYNDYYFNPFSFYNDNYYISFVTSNSWDENLVEYSDITSIGNIMYTSYAIWLILSSIILLLAMIGSIVITIKQNN